MLLALALVPSLASAQAARQQNVLDNLAGAAALASLCEALKLNEAVAAMALSMHGIDVAEGAAEMVRRARAIRAGFGEVTEATVCDAARLLYGTEGISVPNLIVAQTGRESP